MMGLKIDIAKELLDLAKRCGCNFAKFQKRNPKTVLTFEQYRAVHPVPHNSFGSTYGEHREFLEFSLEQHRIYRPMQTRSAWGTRALYGI